MNTTVLKVAAVAGVAYVFRGALINQWYALTGTGPTAATVTGGAATSSTPIVSTPVAGGVRDRLNNRAGSQPLNLDQWNWYYHSETGTQITSEQTDALIVALGGDRTKPISVDAYIAGGKAAGVFPSGLSGLPRMLPLSPDLIRAAAKYPQTAALLADRVYLPAAAWAQLSKRSPVPDPGRAITAREYHAMRTRA